MWQNYWTVAVRALAKSRTYSIINIAGLAIGMAACVMILLYIRYEKSYDSWLPDVDNTYQLQAWYPHPKDNEPIFLQMSAYVSKEAIKKDFPQVTNAVYALSSEPVLYKDGQASPTKNYLISDDDFLKVVNIPLVAGSTLPAAQTAVVTQTEARNRFGTDQVVGRTLTLISKGVKRDFKITGVIRDVPKNSSLKINAILRMDFNSFFAQEPNFLTCWGANRAGSGSSCGQGRTSGNSRRRCPPGKSATSLTSPTEASASIKVTIRTGISSTCATSIWARRKAER